MQSRRSGPPPIVWIAVAALVGLTGVVVAVVLLSGPGDNRATMAGGSSGDLPPVPADRGPTVVWLKANEDLIDDFAEAAPRTGATRLEECDPAATRLNAAVGSVGAYIRRIEDAPDPVLAELLGNNAQAVRALLGACQAGDLTKVEEERRNLTAGLDLVDRRRRQLLSGQ